MNKAKPIYKILDDKGRVLIPKALRDAAGNGAWRHRAPSASRKELSRPKSRSRRDRRPVPEAVRLVARRSNSCRMKRRSASAAARLLELVEQRKGCDK